MKAAIIVDSTACLDEAFARHADIYEIPLTVHFADGTDLIDSSNSEVHREFYQRLVKEEQLPTTSQPQPGAYYELLDELVAKGYDTVFCIHLSSAISGTFQTSKMITDEYQDKLTIYCVDSKSSSVIMEQMVIQAAAAIDNQLPAETIYEQLLYMASESVVYLMVEDLKNLVKGGRLSSTSAFLGGMLQIRPLLYIDNDGKIVLFEKVRTSKKVYRRWQELIAEALENYPKGVRVAFAHADAGEEIAEIKAEFEQLFPQVSFHVAGLSPVIGAHTGRGAKGMGIIPIVD